MHGVIYILPWGWLDEGLQKYVQLSFISRAVELQATSVISLFRIGFSCLYPFSSCTELFSRFDPTNVDGCQHLFRHCRIFFLISYQQPGLLFDAFHFDIRHSTTSSSCWQSCCSPWWRNGKNNKVKALRCKLLKFFVCERIRCLKAHCAVLGKVGKKM